MTMVLTFLYCGRSYFARLLSDEARSLAANSWSSPSASSGNDSCNLDHFTGNEMELISVAMILLCVCVCGCVYIY